MKRHTSVGFRISGGNPPPPGYGLYMPRINTLVIARYFFARSFRSIVFWFFIFRSCIYHP